jgi:hypothetical protein
MWWYNLCHIASLKIGLGIIFEPSDVVSVMIRGGGSGDGSGWFIVDVLNDERKNWPRLIARSMSDKTLVSEIRF